MVRLHGAVFKLASAMETFGGWVLTFMMLLTVADVVLRFWGRPITGTYELVFLAGAVVIACAIPRTSLANAHVQVDFVLEGLPKPAKKGMMAITRLMGIAFFFLLGWNLFALGATLRAKHEVSLTLNAPIFPVVYVLGLCAFVECAVLLSGLLQLFTGEQEGAAEATIKVEVPHE